MTKNQDALPPEEPVLFNLGPYQILSSIGKGGMGEVFHAFDTRCGRRVALKRIRSDLINHPQLYNRFLKEARITSQLSHPAIIPIYEIHYEKEFLYYTMPFVSGDTLKQLLRKTRQLEKQGKKVDPEGSIPSLARVFLAVCQAIAYAHSHGVLHRDVKPENVIIGNYGQVVILDWGLAKRINSSNEEEPFLETPSSDNAELTKIGRVVGTVTYMAPERGLGQPATVQTDIYALGVILYQILTLHHPFKRGTLKEFRKTVHHEIFREPAEIAPYRDVPPMLSRVVKKCLSVSLDERYKSVDQLIHDLENYIEGRSEWYSVAKLDIHNKDDWEFQENVLIAEHMAITRHTEVIDWVNLMISKASFSENTKIEMNVKLGEKGHGVGLMLCIPESSERKHLNDGYCLWLGSDSYRSTKLLRSTWEVVSAPELFLNRHQSYRIRLEKIEQSIYFYLNEVLQFSYISHLPLSGTHVGFLSRDADFEVSEWIVFSGGQNVTVNCLAVPDAFLAHKDYVKALSEYRRIGYSFPGRAEGREALFRAGITLLEQAKSYEEPQKTAAFELALNEFDKLQATAGAPLQYLGKALVYQELHEHEEEIKCFELAYRRYPQHPLIPLLQEHILSRMHEASRVERRTAYHFILFAVQHFQNIPESAKKLFFNLQKHWEIPWFIIDEPGIVSEKVKNIIFGIQLSFWLGKVYVLSEMIDALCVAEEFHPIAICNALFCMIELGSWEFAEGKIEELRRKLPPELIEKLEKEFRLLMLAISFHKKPDEVVEAEHHPFFDLYCQKDRLSKSEIRLLFHWMEILMGIEETAVINQIASKISHSQFDEASLFRFKSYLIWNFLIARDWQSAAVFLHSFPLTTLTGDNSILYLLYGCLLYVTEGKEIAEIHFSAVLDSPFPRSCSLASHFLLDAQSSKLESWQTQAFVWEKRQLFRQLRLFYHCLENKEECLKYEKLEREQIVDQRLFVYIRTIQQ